MDKIKKNKRKFYVDQPEPDIDIPDGDPMYGKTLFDSICTGCHNLNSNGNMGPGLKDVYLRRAGTKSGYYYSLSLSNSNFYWTKKKLFVFLEDPEAMIPDTKMIFEGVKNEWDRACIIEYLHFLKSK